MMCLFKVHFHGVDLDLYIDSDGFEGSSDDFFYLCEDLVDKIEEDEE